MRSVVYACTDSVRLLPIYAAVAVRGYFQKVLCLMVVVLESVRLLRTTTTTTTISCSDGCRIDATTEVYPSPYLLAVLQYTLLLHLLLSPAMLLRSRRVAPSRSQEESECTQSH